MATSTTGIYAPHGPARVVETLGAWVLGVLWVLPLLYAFWSAFHPPAFSTRFALDAPLTLDNFVKACLLDLLPHRNPFPLNCMIGF